MSGITFPLAAHLLKNAVAAAECPLCARSGPTGTYNYVRFPGVKSPREIRPKFLWFVMCHPRGIALPRGAPETN